jgi:hypothetical protein
MSMTRAYPKKGRTISANYAEDEDAVEPVSDDQICVVMCRVFQRAPGPTSSRFLEVLDVVENLIRLRVLREIVALIDRPKKIELPDARAIIRRMIQDAKR